MSTLTLKLRQLTDLALASAYPVPRTRAQQKPNPRFAATSRSVLSAQEYLAQRAARARLPGRRPRTPKPESQGTLALLQCYPCYHAALKSERLSPRHISEWVPEGEDALIRSMPLHSVEPCASTDSSLS